MFRKLQCFISSTGELTKWRDAAKDAIESLDMDGQRFENWPSSPSPPIEQCLQNVAESDAFILILGSRYGSLTSDGISVTQAEFQQAVKLQKPIFAYKIKCDEIDEGQLHFISQVENKVFRCAELSSPDDLVEEIRASFSREFARIFRASYLPPEINSYKQDDASIVSSIKQIADSDSVLRWLKFYYDKGDDRNILQYADQLEMRYGDYNEIVQFVYLAEVSAAINGKAPDEKRIRKAIESWTPIEQDQYWAQREYNLGNAYLALHDFDAATHHYNLALEQDPNFAECWKNLGSIFRQTNFFIEAENHYKKALEINPRLYEANASLAELYINDLHQYQEGLDQLNRISMSRTSGFNASRINGWKAIAYWKMNNLEQAIAQAEDALSVAQDSMWIWKLLGVLYSNQRHIDSNWNTVAWEFWQRYVDRYATDGVAYREMGFIAWMMFNESSQIQWGRLSLSSFQNSVLNGILDDGLVWDRMGHLYEKMGDVSSAINCYEKAAIISPEDFGYCLGVALLGRGDHANALPWLKKAAEKNQPDELSWFNLGLCYANLKMDVEAQGAYLKAIELNAGYAEPQFNLGGLYWNQGRHVDARDQFHLAMERFPNHPLVEQVKKLFDEEKVEKEGRP